MKREWMTREEEHRLDEEATYEHHRLELWEAADMKVEKVVENWAPKPIPPVEQILKERKYRDA